MLIRVEGIVLRAVDYGEGNRILSVLTKQAGKLSMMARGAKKVKSRFSAVSQPFTYGEFVIFRSSPQSMGTINSSELIRSHQRLREELVLSAYAAYLAEMTNRLVEDGERIEGLFEQLLAAFQALEDGKDAEVITNIYEMNMLAIAGFMPKLDACVMCGSGSAELIAWSVEHGGAVCRSCRFRDPQAMEAGEKVLKLLRLFQQVDLRRIGNINISAANKALVSRLIRTYMDGQLHVRWKSRDFLDQLSKLHFDES